MIDDATRAALRQQLLEHEGLKLRPYYDGRGKLTIGVGRNLSDYGISRAEAMQLLEHDLDTVITGVAQAVPWSTQLSPTRQRVLFDVAFNAGVIGLLGFRRMLAALQRGDYQTAAAELIDSTIAPRRAAQLAAMLRDDTVTV